MKQFSILVVAFVGLLGFVTASFAQSTISVLSTGAPSQAIAVNPTQNIIYVTQASNFNGNATEFDGASGTPTNWAMSGTVVGLAVNPATGKSYVLTQAVGSQQGSITILVDTGSSIHQEGTFSASATKNTDD